MATKAIKFNNGTHDLLPVSIASVIQYSYQDGENANAVMSVQDALNRAFMAELTNGHALVASNVAYTTSGANRFGAATTNGVYLNIIERSYFGDPKTVTAATGVSSTYITGSGATKVVKDANGNITINTPTAATPGNGAFTVAGDTGSYQAMTANQSGSSQVTISGGQLLTSAVSSGVVTIDHDAITTTKTADAAIGTTAVNVIKDVTDDGYGHITNVSYASLALKAGAFADHGSVTANNKGYVTGGDVHTAIAGLANAMHFVGVADAAPSGSTWVKDEVATTAAKGDVVIFGVKEYVFDGTAWHELGDESMWASKNNYIAPRGVLEGGGPLSQAYVYVDHKTAPATGASKTVGSNGTTTITSGSFKVPKIITDAYGHVTTAAEVSVTLPTIPTLSKSGTASTASPAHGGTFKVAYNIQVSDHQITYNEATITLPTVTLPTVGNGAFKVGADSGTAYQAMTANQATSTTTQVNIKGGDKLTSAISGGDVTINHDKITTTKTATTAIGSTAVNVIKDVTADGYGHITGVTYASIAIPNVSLVKQANDLSITLDGTNNVAVLNPVSSSNHQITYSKTTVSISPIQSLSYVASKNTITDFTLAVPGGWDTVVPVAKYQTNSSSVQIS